MICAARRPDGERCRRDATLAVTGGDDGVIELLCESDGWRIARELGDVDVRELTTGRGRVWHLTSGRKERKTS